MLGDVDLAGPAEAVLSRGAEAAAAWNEAVDATAKCASAVEGFASLGMVTHIARLDNRRLRRLVLAALDVEQYDRLPDDADAWALLRAGVTIDLADRATFAERGAAIGVERQRRQAEDNAAAQWGGLRRLTAVRLSSLAHVRPSPLVTQDGDLAVLMKDGTLTLSAALAEADQRDWGRQ